MPGDVRAELAKHQHREGRRADPVDDVIVPVNADASPARDCCADPLDGGADVSEQQRVIAGKLGVEVAASSVGLVVPATGEHRCRRLADAELACE